MRSVIEKPLGRIARWRGLSITLVGLVALVISASLSLLVRMPQPAIHDEFSYLLAADTFAHGRLTNPPHPLWVHFESMHIIHQPTYASKYPPGQGLMLAAGQVIGGHPIVGVWISTALACGALCWMLMAWLPPRWALLGGLLATLHPLILQWSQNYWGGAVAMGGGALVLGAFRRIVKRPRIRDALLLGLGMAVLANSRPYEGMVLSLLVMAALLAWTVGRDGPPARVSLRHIVLPISIVLALTAVGMGFYNRRVTGNALRMPYMVHEETYGVAPVFLWQQASPQPTYRHKEIRDFHISWWLPIYTAQRSAASLALESVHRILFLAKNYFPPIALLPRVRYQYVTLAVLLFTMLWALRKDRWGRLALLISIVFTIALLPETWILSHYTAPVAGLFFVLGLQTVRHLGLWRWRKMSVGQFAVWAILVLFTVSLVSFYVDLSRADDETSFSLQRERILAHLKQAEGRHLVIVRYGPNHSPHSEWVYNDAHIDGAEVVLAREMDATQNHKLLEYFKDRRIWLLEADARPPELVPYPVQIEHTEDSVRPPLDIKSVSPMGYK